MNERASSVVLRVKPDKKSIRDSKKAVGDVAEAIHGTASSQHITTKAVEATIAAHKQQAKAVKAVAQEQKILIAAQQKSASVAEAYNRNRSRAGQTFGAAGDVDTAFQTVGSSIGGQAGGTIQAVGDVAAVTEQVGLLGQSAIGTARAISDSQGALGGLSRGLQAVVPGLGKTGGGLVALGAAGAGVGLAVGAAAVAVTKYTQAAQKQAEELGAALDSQRSVAEFIASGATAAEAEALVAQLDKQIATEQTLFDQRDAAYQSFEDQLAGADIEVFGQKIGEFGDVTVAVSKVFSAQEQVLADSVNEASANLAGLKSERALVAQALADGQFAANSAAKTEEDLAKTRENANQAISQLAQREGDLVRQRQQALSDLSVDRGIRDSRDREDEAEREAQHRDRLADIAEDGTERVEQINADSVKQVEQISKNATRALAKTVSDQTKQISTVETDYRKRALQEQQDFIKAVRRAQRDARQSELDSIINNDIIAAITAQRTAEQRAADRQEDYSEEQAALQQATAEKVAAIRQETAVTIAELKTKRGEEIKGVRAATDERIQEAQRAVDAQLVAEQRAEGEREKQRKKQLERQAEDDKLADARRKRAFDEQIRQIEAKRIAEQRSIQQAIVGYQQVGQTINQTVQQAGQVAQVTAQQAGQLLQSVADQLRNLIGSSGASVSSGGSGGSRQRVPFAKGGIVPRGQRVLAEFERERSYDEAVIPLSPQAIQRYLAPVIGQGGGGTRIVNNYNAPFNLGEIASPRQVVEAIEDYHRAAMSGISRAVQGTE